MSSDNAEKQRVNVGADLQKISTGLCHFERRRRDDRGVVFIVILT